MALLWLYHAIHIWIIAVAGLFCLVAVAIPMGALWLQHWGKKVLPAILMRSLGLKYLLQGFSHAPSYLLHNPSLVAKVVLLQAAVFLFDAGYPK